MITQELLNSSNNITYLGEEINTTTFILSLFESDELDITEAFSYLKNFINVKKPIEELALKFVAYNFQLYKENSDTILFDLGFDNVYGSLAEQSIRGFYSILKEFMPPYTTDWVLKQTSIYNPTTNLCDEKCFWVSEKGNFVVEWATLERMLARIICTDFDNHIISINARLFKQLKEQDLALFFDLEEFYKQYGSNDYRNLKNNLL